MNYIYKIGYFVALLISIASCTDYSELEYEVNKPESVALQEEIDAYDALASYASEGLMLGTSVSQAAYEGQAVPYRMINSNFNEITVNSGINHGAIVQSDGSLVTVGAEDFMGLATEAGLSVYGQGLVWNKGQNADFLNSTIAPIVIPAQNGPAWMEQVNLDFESDDASGYQSNSDTDATLSFTADGGGADGSGRALVVTNSAVRENDWQSQLFVTFETPTEEGDVYRLTMDVRADEAANMATQAQTGPGAYKHWDFFGGISATTEWAAISVEMTISAETSGCNTIAFNLGSVATSYYFDNVVVGKLNEEGGGGPTWDLLSGADFETDDASNYQSNSEVDATLSFTANGGGADGSGRALVVTNSEVRENDWQSQLFFTFGAPTEVGQQLRLTMDVKADEAASMATQAQTGPGAYKHWDFFGGINATTEWNSINVQITISEETSGCNTVAFNLGTTATNYYFDNIEVRWYNEDGGGEQIIERSPQEKIDTLSYHMEKWITGIAEVSNDFISAWEVVRNPMDDTNPDELKTGLGMEPASGDFYWQDYLGKDYAVLAFKLAKDNVGAEDLLFISDSSLFSNIDKCKSLINYVAYIEGKGASIDGIDTQMNIGLDSDEADISEMFELLAATGKIIRVSDLSVNLNGVEVTEEVLYQQADKYKFVLEAYALLVPADQMYGVSLASPYDDGAEKEGLWFSESSGFVRKPSYASFSDGLNGL